MIGIDEVGRGCWAGPLLVVAARQTTTLPTSLADSKVLSKKKRQELFHDIQISCDIGEGWVDAIEIDKLGLTLAMKLGVERALKQLEARGHEEIIMDGNYNYCPAQFMHVRCVIDADASQPLVSAASIYAKVRRDTFMAAMEQTHPGYSFAKHVGYGTKQHQEALQKLGICELHRMSYKPVQAYV